MLPVSVHVPEESVQLEDRAATAEFRVMAPEAPEVRARVRESRLPETVLVDVYVAV